MPSRQSIVRDSCMVEYHLSTKFIAGGAFNDPLEHSKRVLASVPKSKHLDISNLRSVGVSVLNRGLCRFLIPAFGVFF